MVSICDVTDAIDTARDIDCYSVNSSTIGGLRFEDYKVTNPTAVQFDPAVRLKELAALGPSITSILCQAAPLGFADPPPTITFDKNTVKGQIYWMPVGPSDGNPFEFMDVQFSNFTASNGYSSPQFGFRMFRELSKAGVEYPQYKITVQPGNPGLQNVAGLTTGVGLLMDSSIQTATLAGTAPSSDPLRQAIFGAFVNSQSILNAANFTVTVPAPSGISLWSGAEISSLAGQAAPWMVAEPQNLLPLNPPFNCTTTTPGYFTCVGRDQTQAFGNMLLLWGGEYLGLHTQQSFNVLVNNLHNWASANAPIIDPNSSVPQSTYSIMLDSASTLSMLWPTLRADPRLSSSDQQLIDNWIANTLVALPSNPAFTSFPNDLGDWAAEIAMADSIRRSDHASFAFGIQRFYGALIQMRADGSLPLSARLSACSAVYTNVDIGHLVSIAEMAATQGYDLWSLSVNGRTLETAIEFLLNAHDNPALLAQYSKAGGGACFEGQPGDPPDFSLVFAPGNLRSNVAWMEPYLARFPFSPTAARIRNILGPNVSAAPFPLMNSESGLNTTCAFRKAFEFQPVNGANVAIVSGQGQTLGPNQGPLAPLSVSVTDKTGKPLVGVLVSFAVTQGSANLSSPAEVLTDAGGLATATVSVNSGKVTVTATALGSSAAFLFPVSGLAIYAGGITGIGGSVPAVTSISPGALFSIYGQDFVPSGTGRRVNPGELVNGVLPSSLLGVCVSVGGKTAPLLDVYSGQINAVVPLLNSGTATAAVIVTTGCGTSGAVQSPPQSVSVLPRSAPEFLYFALNADGVNPVAAEYPASGAVIGPSQLGVAFSPAHPGDVVTVFASAFGPTNPPVAPGATATTAAPMVNTAVTVRLGSVTLDPSDVLYAGAAYGELISQLNIRIPQGIPAGNQPLQIRIDSIASLPGAYLTIAAP